MFWRLLQVYWLVSILDLRCTVFGAKTSSKTLKLKNKNNGRINPFSLEIFPTSVDGENGSDDEFFFNDKNFFDDVDNFYENTFGEKNMTTRDLFTKSLEESRNRYLEDVINIDKMFKNPVKKNINELLKRDAPKETTQAEIVSKNLNTSEKTSISNENIERNVPHTTKRSVDISKRNKSNAQSSPINTLNSKNIANSSLFLDIQKASGTNVVANLVRPTEEDNKDVGEDETHKGRNKKLLGSDADDEILGQNYSKSQNPVLQSMNVVTEISVQEIVDGRTIQRKPSSEELRLIENKMLRTSLQNNSDQNNNPGNQEVILSEETAQNLSKNRHEANNDTENTENDLLNEVIDDLSSFLNVDPNFADDGMERILSENDEEVRDMDLILNDKNDEYQNRNEQHNEHVSFNNNNKDINDKNESNNEHDNSDKLETMKNKDSLKNNDPRDYRKFFHTEHKNLSNVKDVKIIFSETEGDFPDDDDDNDDSEYPLNVPLRPEVIDEEKKSSDVDNAVTTTEALNTNDQHIENTRDTTEIFTTTEVSTTTLDEASYQNSYTQENNKDTQEVTTIPNIAPKLLQSTEATTIVNSYNEDIQPTIVVDLTNPTKDDVVVDYNKGTTDLPPTDNALPIESTPSFIEEEEILAENGVSLQNFEEIITLLEGSKPEKESVDIKSPETATASVENENHLNIKSKFDERISISSKNINDTLEQPITEISEDINDFTTDISDELIATTDSDKYMDDIDRTMALIKQILEKSGNESDGTDNETQTEQNNTEINPTSDISNIDEIVTISSDISTIPIDLVTNGFTENENIDITTQTILDQGFTLTNSSRIEIITVTDNIIDITTLFSIGNTLENNSPEKGSVQATSAANDGTEKYSEQTESFKVKNANITVEDSEVEPHEITSSEVESLYNSKIEEYESMEDNSDDSKEKDNEREKIKENRGESVLFGNSDNNSEKGKTFDYIQRIDKKNKNSILNDDDKEKYAEDKTSSNVEHFEGLDSYVTLHEDGNAQAIPTLRAIILNNTAEFSVKISREDETFYVPAFAHIAEFSNIVNITWKSTEYLNNSITLRISEKVEFYMIKEITINFLIGNEFIKQKKLVAFNPDPVLDDSVSGKNRVVMMKDGTYIFFSNVDFLKKNYESLEHSEASMRERRLWHIEIASICLAVVVIIAIVLYVVAVKTKRKITLREKNELAQVTHC